MKIALVAPSAVPFTPGGAERLWWGLTNYVNRHTGHAMELIKLPSPERNLWEIVQSYRSGVDPLNTVIVGFDDSEKYPIGLLNNLYRIITHKTIVQNNNQSMHLFNNFQFSRF